MKTQHKDNVVYYKRKPLNECTDVELAKASECLVKRIKFIMTHPIMVTPKEFNDIVYISEQITSEIIKQRNHNENTI